MPLYMQYRGIFMQRNYLSSPCFIPEPSLMKYCFLVLSFWAVSVLPGCRKETAEAGRPRIRRITEESGGVLTYVYQFAYNEEGTVKEILVVDQTRYAKTYLFSHTQNSATRRYRDEDGLITDLDSAVLNAAGRPLAKYRSKNRKGQLERSFQYNANGELAQIGTAYGSNADSVAYANCYHTDGDLVRIEDPVVGDELYEYDPEKPTQVGSADMLDVLFSRGRILLPYTHLIKRRVYQSGHTQQRYQYEWNGDRIAAVTYRTDSNEVAVQRIIYEN